MLNVLDMAQVSFEDAGTAWDRCRRRIEEGKMFIIYMTEHLLLSFALAGLTEYATRVASVNASLTPLFLIAEHSAFMLASDMIMFPVHTHQDI